MWTSFIPYLLPIQMFRPVLNVDIIFPNSIGLKSPSLFLSVHRLPTFRYTLVRGVYVGNSSRFLLF